MTGPTPTQPDPPERPTLRHRPLPGEGEPTVFVADEQAEAVVDVARWHRLVEDVLGHEGVAGNVEVSLLFVDRETISRLNAQFMGSEGPTDVLAFPIDEELGDAGRWPDGGTEGPDRMPPDPDDVPLLLGDVVVCPAVAAEQAPTHAGSDEDEIALLVVHGLLHLLGHDHLDAGQRGRMQARERELLARCWGPLGADPWSS